MKLGLVTSLVCRHLRILGAPSETIFSTPSAYSNDLLVVSLQDSYQQFVLFNIVLQISQALDGRPPVGG